MANGLRAESIKPCTGREDAHFNRRIRRTDNECRTKNKNNKKQPSTLKLGVKWHWNGALVRLGARRCPDVLFFSRISSSEANHSSDEFNCTGSRTD